MDSWIFLQKNSGVRQAEAVDGLLHVPHGEEAASPLGDRLEDAVLDLVGILVLVYHHLKVSPGDDL